MAADPRLIFYSPIPPVKSGTADYFDIFLRKTRPVFREHEALLAVDPAFYPELPASYQGIPVAPYGEIRRREEDVSVFFIANNQYHRYCLDTLRRPKVGRYVSLVHDVQCFMNVMDMLQRRQYGFGPEDAEAFLEHEIEPEKVRWLYHKSKDGELHPMLVYLITAQGLVLKRSDVVITHSKYAMLRFLLETRAQVKLPTIRVADHLVDDLTTVPIPPARKPKFVAGLFGWVAPSKLVVEVIEGFSRFAAGLSPEERKDVGLRIVGQLPDPAYYDPVGAADRLPHRELVNFQGFVPLDRFESEMQACSLVFNLRFPSCGESSGTLARAHRLGVPVVTTAYQAFHEEASDAQVSVDPARIAGEIAALLARYHAEWKASGRTRTRERDLGSLQEHDIRRVFRRVLDELAVGVPAADAEVPALV